MVINLFVKQYLFQSIIANNFTKYLRTIFKIFSSDYLKDLGMNVIKSEDYTRLTLEAKAHYNFNVNSVKILNNIVFIICNTKQHPLI